MDFAAGVNMSEAQNSNPPLTPCINRMCKIVYTLQYTEQLFTDGRGRGLNQREREKGNDLAYLTPLRIPLMNPGKNSQKMFTYFCTYSYMAHLGHARGQSVRK
jgi:hypothetical protein